MLKNQLSTAEKSGLTDAEIRKAKVAKIMETLPESLKIIPKDLSGKAKGLWYRDRGKFVKKLVESGNVDVDVSEIKVQTQRKTNRKQELKIRLNWLLDNRLQQPGNTNWNPGGLVEELLKLLTELLTFDNDSMMNSSQVM